ncbi:MAG: hypothetical protein ACKO04_03600 [Actinomycetes bacterium]
MSYDEFDGDPDATQPGRVPESAAPRSRASEAILRELLSVVENAPGIPMSASVRINRDEVLDLIEEAISILPDELRSARWLLKDREEFKARTEREAEEIIADARSRVAQMVQRTEVVKAAEARARQVIEDAEAQSRRMRLETEDYCDQKLASFENVLVRVHKTVAAGRKKLQAPSLEESELGELEDPTGSVPAVFDQDL